MNQATKSTYRIDLVFQGLVFIPMMLCYALGLGETGFLILGALLQIGVGVVQVLSGAFHSIKYDDSLHKKYLLGAIGYLAFLFIYANLAFNNGDTSLIFFLFVIPCTIATWYFYQSYQCYGIAPENINDPNVKSNPNLNDDLLDDIMIS